MSLRLIVVFAVGSFLTCLPAHGQAVPASSQDDDRDLWLTVRLTPRYSENTANLLAKCCELPEVAQRKEEIRKHLIQRYYGIVTDHLMQWFGQLNKNAPDRAPQDRWVQVPFGPHWRGTIEVPVSEGETALGIAERETGFPAGPSTLEDLRRLNPGTDLDHLKPGQTIKVANASDRVSFRLKKASFLHVDEIKERLSEDKVGVVGYPMVEAAMRLVPSLGLAAAKACPESCPDMIAAPLPEVPPELFDNVPNMVRVAVVDSGLGTQGAPIDKRFRLYQKDYSSPHTFGENTAGGGDLWDNPFTGVSCAESFGGHGTHVAGLATGRWVAQHLTCQEQGGPKKPLAQAIHERIELMVLKVTPVEARDPAIVLPSALEKAIQYARKNKANIINLSLAGPLKDSDDRANWERLFQSFEDVLFVVAAGNGKNGKGFDLEAQGSPEFYPALFSKKFTNVITVAAHDGSPGHKLACFSNYAKEAVDLAAPGVNITSTVTACRKGTLSGTSQATPLVTFAAALLYIRGLTLPESIKTRLISSVDVYPNESEERKLRSGGVLNLNKALRYTNDVVELKSDGILLEGTVLGLEDGLQVPEDCDPGSTCQPFKREEIVKIVFNCPEKGLHRITVLRPRHHEDRLSGPRQIREARLPMLHHIDLQTTNGVLHIPIDNIKDLIFATKRQ